MVVLVGVEVVFTDRMNEALAGGGSSSCSIYYNN